MLWVIEQIDEFAGGAFSERIVAKLLEYRIEEYRIEIGSLVVNDAIDSAGAIAPSFIGSDFEFIWNPVWVFDDCAVHVDDVDPSLGAFFEINGAEPRICACEPLAVSRGFLGDRFALSASQSDAMDQRAGGFAGQCMAEGCGWQVMAVTDKQSASGGELSGV